MSAFYSLEDMLAVNKEIFGPARKGSAQWLKETSAPVYCFGAGHAGKLFVKFLRQAGMAEKVKGFLSSDPKQAGTRVDGLEVFSPSHPQEHGENPLIIITVIAPEHYREIQEECARYGYEVTEYQPVVDFIWVFANLELCEERAKPVLDLWSDGQSRDVYRSVLRSQIRFKNCYSSLDARYLPPLPDHPQYMDPVVPTRFFRHVVDGGASGGELYAAYLKRSGGCLERYYGFEPNANEYDKMVAALGNDSRVECHNVIMWKEKAKLPFFTNADSPGISSVWREGGKLQDADSIDNILSGREVTMIKMDVESCEPMALEGARKTLEARRPALAICMYHNLLHLWEIPLWIARLDLGYALYCNHYTRMLNETVLYAVPK